MSIEEEVATATSSELVAYLQGALKDGTFSRRHGTHRIGQREREWLELQRRMLVRLGHRSWTYREGTTRDFWILETGARFLSTRFDPTPLIALPEGLAYARGFFDAEGGVPRSPDARFYIQFVQKDRTTLHTLRDILETDGIRCGKLHNPSVAVDPEYWRFYVAAACFDSFVESVGSWHPRKRLSIQRRITLSACRDRGRIADEKHGARVAVLGASR